MNYLREVGHSRLAAVNSLNPERLKMKWQTGNNYEDAGVVLMRHVEIYTGDRDWDAGLSDDAKIQKK